MSRADGAPAVFPDQSGHGQRTGRPHEPVEVETQIAEDATHLSASSLALVLVLARGRRSLASGAVLSALAFPRSASWRPAV